MFGQLICLPSRVRELQCLSVRSSPRLFPRPDAVVVLGAAGVPEAQTIQAMALQGSGLTDEALMKEDLERNGLIAA